MNAHYLTRNSDPDNVFEIILASGFSFAITFENEDFIDYTPAPADSQDNFQTLNGLSSAKTATRSNSTSHVVMSPIPRSLAFLPKIILGIEGFDRSRDHFAATHPSSGCPSIMMEIVSRPIHPVALGKISCSASCALSPSPAPNTPSHCLQYARMDSQSVADETNQNLTRSQKEASKSFGTHQYWSRHETHGVTVVSNPNNAFTPSPSLVSCCRLRACKSRETTYGDVTSGPLEPSRRDATSARAEDFDGSVRTRVESSSVTREVGVLKQRTQRRRPGPEEQTE